MDLINYIGKHKGIRYGEKIIPVELRFYDNCAVKYLNTGRVESYVLLPYDNIQNCQLVAKHDAVFISGHFTMVCFSSIDTKHNFPIYDKTIKGVHIPQTPNILSEIANHSPIKIHTIQEEDKNNEQS